MIPFSNLEDRQHLKKCIDTLSQPQNQKEVVRMNPKRSLDPDEEGLLTDIFENSQIKEFLSPEINDYLVTDLNAFLQGVAEKSITYVLSQLSPHISPTIGQFFHLPEVNPAIVRKFDRKIITTCIINYAEALVCDLNIPLFCKYLVENSVNVIEEDKKELINKLISKLRSLKHTIEISTDTVSLKEFEEDIEAQKKGETKEEEAIRKKDQAIRLEAAVIRAWRHHRKRLISDRRSEDVETFKLPQWVTNLISKGDIPHDDYHLKIDIELKEPIDFEFIDNYFRKVDIVRQIFDALYAIYDKAKFGPTFTKVNSCTLL